MPTDSRNGRDEKTTTAGKTAPFEALGFAVCPPEKKNKATEDSVGKRNKELGGPTGGLDQDDPAMAESRSILEDTQILRLGIETQGLTEQLEVEHNSCSRKLRDLRARIRAKIMDTGTKDKK